MSSSHRLAKNTLLLTAASVGQKAVAFFYFALIARSIGVEDTGAYFLALAMITTIGVLDDLGLTSVLIREVAKAPEKASEWLQNVIGAKLIAMPVTVAVALFLPTFVGYSYEAALLVKIAIFIMLADTISLTFYGTLRGLHLLKYEAVGIFIGQGTSAVVGALFILTGHATLPLLVAALIAGSVWNACFSVAQVVRRLGWKALRPQFSMGSAPVRAAFAFFLAAVFVKIYSYVDSFMLNAFIGKEAVGLYSVAYKLTYAFQFLPLAFVGALYPTFAAHAKEPEALRKVFLDAEWYLALLGAPIVFGIFALAPEIITFFYGADYAGSIVPLSILIFVLIAIFLDFPVGSLLNATGKQFTKTVIMGSTMVINAVANFVLVPRLEVMGASIAAVISFTFMFVTGWSMLPKELHLTIGDLLRRVGGLLAAAMVMAAVVLILKPHMYWMATIPVGAVVFVAIAFATKSFTIDHVRAFRLLLQRKPYANTPSDS